MNNFKTTRDLLKDKLDIDSINWEGIDHEYLKFWNNHEICKSFVIWRKVLTSRGTKAFLIPDSIKSNQWTVSIDLICTGLVLKAFDSIPHALDFFGEYWKWANEEIYSEFGATLEHLKVFIQEETEAPRTINQTLIKEGAKPKRIYINPKRLKQRLESLHSEGALDMSLRPKDIQQIMNQLGWKLTTRGWTEK